MRIHKISPALALALYASEASAHGDMSSLIPVLGSFITILAFLFSVPTLKRTTQRLIVGACFGGSMVGVWAVLGDTPYVTNKTWLVPTILVVPLLGWALGYLLAKRLQ